MIKLKMMWMGREMTAKSKKPRTRQEGKNRSCGKEMLQTGESWSKERLNNRGGGLNMFASLLIFMVPKSKHSRVNSHTDTDTHTYTHLNPQGANQPLDLAVKNIPGGF